AATRNLMTLEQWGALGPYGFWDSLDFTRPSPGQPFAMVRTAMAHHVGMTLVAITNALHQQVWQRRFHSDAMVQAAELLLQERVPRRLLVARAPRAPHEAPQQAQQAEPPVIRRITKVGSAAPRV